MGVGTVGEVASTGGNQRIPNILRPGTSALLTLLVKIFFCAFL